MKQNNLLKFARMDAGLTQEELAEMLGVSGITIYRWERGETHPHLYFRSRLCKIFQLSEQALGFQEKAESDPPLDHGSSFLIDPCLPASPTVPLGQQSLLKEIGSSHYHMIGLTGLPGSGKTTVAQALASLPDVRQQVEGVLWGSVGQESKPLRHLQRWLLLLGAECVPEQIEEAQDLLRVILRGRKMLIVLDDLWNAEDIVPYQPGSQCRYVLTTRLPVVANTMCDAIYHPCPLTEQQAFHLLSSGLPSVLVREHRNVLRALCQQVGCLPVAIEHMGRYVRCEARSHSQRRLQEALTDLFQPASYLHIQMPPTSCSLALSIKRSVTWLSSSTQHLFFDLARSFPAAPATFSEQQAADLFQASQQFQLHDLDRLIDSGLLSTTAKSRYQFHPIIAAYARLMAPVLQGASQ